jgi:KDO2-lipid IV(A) lauroyltransferase
LRNWAELLPVVLVLPLVSVTPQRLGLALSRGLGLLLARLLRNYREICRVNLRIAFGEGLSESQVRRCVQGAFVNTAQTLFELVRLSRTGREQVLRYTLPPTGYEEYREALSQGRGVIAVSAHFGNWYWPVVCAAMEGFRVSIIVRPLDNPLLDRLMNRLFERWGIRVIARRHAVVAALAALRRGETVALMVDQNAAVNGRFVPFFGVPASTMQGLNLLRRGTGAEVVAIHSQRLGPSHRVIAHWLKDLPPGDDEALAGVHRHFEAVIRDRKEDYFWLHPRWKKRPPREPTLYPGLRV